MKASDSTLITLLGTIPLSGICLLMFSTLRNTISFIIFSFVIFLFIIELIKLIFYGLEVE